MHLLGICCAFIRDLLCIYWGFVVHLLGIGYAFIMHLFYYLIVLRGWIWVIPSIFCRGSEAG